MCSKTHVEIKRSFMTSTKHPLNAAGKYICHVRIIIAFVFHFNKEINKMLCSQLSVILDCHTAVGEGSYRKFQVIEERALKE